VKKIHIRLVVSVIAALMFYSCTKAYTREDLDKMTDRTFYLLPVESTYLVPVSIDSWKEIEGNIGNSVVKGVKELDIQKFKESIEKRYGIIVDVSYFEKARTDAAESIKYFKALKDPNATGSNTYTAILSSGYNGYLDSPFYLEIEEIKKNKPCIIISHNTSIDGNEIKTDIKVSIVTNDANKGALKLARSVCSTIRSGGDILDSSTIKYDEIYKALSKITEYKYMEDDGWGLSRSNYLYLDGTM